MTLMSAEIMMNLNMRALYLDTPALTYLQYLDCARKGYPILNLNSLLEAKIDICYHSDILSDPTNLFNGLKNVEILSLTGETMELIHTFHEAVPVFENLSHLTFVSKEGSCWVDLRFILEKSPKLKTLTIQGVLHFDEDGEPLCECLLGYSFLLTCRIEVLEITIVFGDLMHLKHILENLPYLKALEVHVLAVTKSERIKIKKKLLKIPRASECKIKVKFS